MGRIQRIYARMGRGFRVESGIPGLRGGCGRVSRFVRVHGTVVIDVDDAPGAGDAAAAGGVEVVALGEVEVDVVEDGDGEALGLGVVLGWRMADGGFFRSAEGSGRRIEQSAPKSGAAKAIPRSVELTTARVRWMPGMCWGTPEGISAREMVR